MPVFFPPLYAESLQLRTLQKLTVFHEGPSLVLCKDSMGRAISQAASHFSQSQPPQADSPW